MRNFFDFTGKKFIVTGASSGIGRSVAVELSKQGAGIILVARDEKRLNETLQNMEGTGHLIFPLDLAKTDDFTDLFTAAASGGNKIDGIAHCAGIAPICSLRALSRASMENCMAVNFYSFIELVKQASKKKFRAEKMSCVAVSTSSVLYPQKCQTIYVASKAALNAAIQALSMELYNMSIRVNAVSPGVVDTAMFQKAQEQMEIIDSSGSVKNNLDNLFRLTQPEQIAHSVMYLLSAASSAVTGRCIFADNGGLII